MRKEKNISIGDGLDRSIKQDDRRTEDRLPARLEARLRLMLDSSPSDDVAPAEIIMMDISKGGVAAAGFEGLAAGLVVMLEVPLLGWRHAQVMWIHGTEAGCRFLQPLTDEELRAAIARSPRVRESFPGLIP